MRLVSLKFYLALRHLDEYYHTDQFLFFARGKKDIYLTNRFAIFSSIEIYDDTIFDVAPFSCEDTIVYSPNSTNWVKPITPSIYTRNIVNFSTFNDVLIKNTTLNIYVCAYSFFSIVQPNDNFKAIANHFIETNTCLHIFRSCSEYSFKIIIRNLHHSIISAYIFAQLLNGEY